MRTKLMAAVAATLMGMGGIAQASSTPYQAVIDAAAVMAQGSITVADDPNNPGNFNQDRYIDATITPGDGYDFQRGAELAGLVWAQQIGAGSGTVQTYITNVTANIITDVNANWGGQYTGDEAYGVARAGQLGAPGATSAISNYYSSFADTAAVNAKIATVVGNPVGEAANGVWNLSYHVLATNLVGDSKQGDWEAGLLSNLGQMATNGSAQSGPAVVDTTTRALGAALWALKTAGVSNGATTGGTNDATHVFAQQTLAQLKLKLVDTANLGSSTTDLYDQATGTFFTNDLKTTSGNAEDLAYAILALKAFNDAGDATLIANLEATLAASISATDGTPFNVVSNPSGFYSAQYSAAALQALPEPAALSLLAVGGLGLLARRRRQA